MDKQTAQLRELNKLLGRKITIGQITSKGLSAFEDSVFDSDNPELLKEKYLSLLELKSKIQKKQRQKKKK